MLTVFYPFIVFHNNFTGERITKKKKLSNKAHYKLYCTPVHKMVIRERMARLMYLVARLGDEKSITLQSSFVKVKRKGPLNRTRE